MWPALKTSSSSFASKFFLGRSLWIVIAALVLSTILYLAFRVPETSSLRGDEAARISDAAKPEPAGDIKIGVQPASFQQITEIRDGALNRLNISGDAEPGAVIILTNRGERLRQVRVDELGQWGVTLNMEPGPMVLEAQLYTDENRAGIRSQETIFRLPAPESEDLDAAKSETSALIMVTAPGSPSRIIQSPFDGMPTTGPLGLSVVDYDYSGGIIITGTSSVPGRIRIFAQDAVIGETGIGVSGRWNFIAGRILRRGEVEIRAELIAAQGIPNAPTGPTSISVPFNFLPPLREDETDGSGALSVSFDPLQWQIRRTLIGGGGQSTVIFSPDAAK